MSTADYRTMSDNVTDESQMGRDLEASSCGLIRGIVLTFAWRQKYT
jgi:hypothetical protein